MRITSDCLTLMKLESLGNYIVRLGIVDAFHIIQTQLASFESIQDNVKSNSRQIRLQACMSNIGHAEKRERLEVEFM